MKFYTPTYPPKSGNAKRIWTALTASGFNVKEIHYNVNCWSRGKEMGYGTWAGELIDGTGFFCGYVEGRGVYMQSVVAPYTKRFLV